MIQNIIFDFDGVLVDSEILVIRAFCEYLRGLNIIITEKEFASYTGNKTINVIEKLSSRLGIKDTEKFYNDIMTGDLRPFPVDFSAPSPEEVAETAQGVNLSLPF